VLLASSGDPVSFNTTEGGDGDLDRSSSNGTMVKQCSVKQTVFW